MAFGRVNVGGGMKLEGIEKYFKVATGQTIKKGQFVKIDDSIKVAPSQLINNGQSKEVVIAEVAGNKGLLVWTNYDTLAMYCRLFEVSADKQTFTLLGATTQLTTAQAYNIKSITLEDNKVLVTCNQMNFNNIVGLVITVNGNVVTSNVNMAYTGSCQSCIPMKLTSNKVALVFHGQNSSRISYPYVNIYNIDNSTMTLVTSIMYGSYPLNGNMQDVVCVNNNAYMLLTTNGSDVTMCYDFNIVGDVVTFTKHYQIGNFPIYNGTPPNASASMVRLEPNKVGILHMSPNPTTVIKLTIINNSIVEKTVFIATNNNNQPKLHDVGNGRYMATYFVRDNGGYTETVILDNLFNILSRNTISQYDAMYLDVIQCPKYAIVSYSDRKDSYTNAYIYGNIIDTEVLTLKSTNMRNISGVAMQVGQAGDTIKISTL